MVTFNILGCCASREPINNLQKLVKGVEVNQYVAFINPISLFSQKGEREMSIDDLKDYSISNFRKRNLCFDVNKQALEYLFAKESDFLIIDILSARHAMIKKDEHYITIDPTTIKKTEKEDQAFGWADYAVVNPFTDVDEQAWKQAIEQLCNEVLSHYAPEQIILLESYAATKSIDFGTGKIYDLLPDQIVNVIKWNNLFKQLLKLLKENIGNCHVIEFPNINTVFAEKNSSFGNSVLHYWPPHYDHVAKSLNIIMKRLPSPLEKEALNTLKEHYEQSANYIAMTRYLKSEFDILHKEIALSGYSSTLTDINNFDEYLDCLKNISSQYLVVLAVRDTPGDNLPDTIVNKIRNMGFTAFSKQRRRMYIGVAYKSLIVCDSQADKPEVKTEYSNTWLSLKACSSPFTQDNCAKIIIGGIDYAVNQRGINIVVYDTDRKMLIDSVAFDQHFSATDINKNKGFKRKENISSNK